MKLLKTSGYNLAYRNILNKKNGGVAILIKDHLKFKECDDLLVFQVGEFEKILWNYSLGKAQERL